MILHGEDPFLECSSKGDRRFSAFGAKIKSRNNRSIEELYQASKKFEDGTTGLTWREAKGRKAVNYEECAKLYDQLWYEYLQENPELLSILVEAKGLSDIFGQPGHCCQATSLWNIRNSLLKPKESTVPVLTRPLKRYHDKYSRRTNPKSLMKEYQANMLEHLKYQFPEVPVDKLSRKVNQIVQERFKDRLVDYLDQPEAGNAKPILQASLLSETDQLNRDIITPYGAFYCSIDKDVSMFSDYIKGQQALRKKIKQEELIAEAKGQLDLKQIKFLGQLNTKININSLSGVALSNVSFRSAINYNAITSVARYSTMSAYAVAEMCMADNYYLYNENRAINWVVNLLRNYPGDVAIKRVVANYSLKIPPVEEVIGVYVTQVNSYDKFAKNLQLKKLIANLTDYQRTFVFYGYNLYRTITYNTDSFKTFFAPVIKLDDLEIPTGEVQSFGSLPDEMIRTYVITAFADEIPNGMTLDEVATKLPDINGKLVAAYNRTKDHLSKFDDLFFTLIALPVIPSEVSYHKNMMRKITLISDTDSILFTNVHWVRWYTGDIRITQEANRFNAFVVMLTSKLFQHHFGYLTASLNVDLPNMNLVSYKNEYTYDVFLRTAISKHYCGYISYREGTRLSPPKLDIKGKQFRGSDLAKTTAKFVDWFIRHIFDKYLTSYSLTPEDLISQVIKFEQRIKTSILSGSVEFLGLKPLKFKADYKIPESSNYLYYELWEAVFRDKYGEIHIPTKCRELLIHPIKLNGLSVLDPMKKIDPDIHKRLIDFVKAHPKRTISRILIPLDISIPEELRAIADYRKVIKGNSLPISLILSSFNIINNSSSKMYNMYSDIYPELLHTLESENAHIYTGEEEGHVEEVDDPEIDQYILEDEDWDEIDEADD